MNAGSADPNNHVPEVSPDDAWDDPLLLDESSRTFTAIPPRRVSAAVATFQDEGLRIEPREETDEPDAEDIVHRLEVNEIGATPVVKLRSDFSPAPKQLADRSPELVSRPVMVKRAEGHHWGTAHPQSIRWIIGGGLGVALLVIVALMLLPAINRAGDSKPVAPVVASSLEVEFKEEMDAAADFDAMLAAKTRAEKIFTRYARAKDASEVIPLVRDGSKLADRIRREWSPVDVPADWEVPADAMWMNTMDEDSHQGILSGSYPDGTRFWTYFTRHRTEMKVDWRATTAAGSATFQELEKGTGDGSEIRGRLSLAEFYTSSFPESEYESYRLVSKDGGSTIWCYAKSGSMVADKLGQLLRPGEIVPEVDKEVKVTLRLERIPRDSLPNQWLIADLLHADWSAP